MFKLNFKIVLRNIWKNKTSSLINICGLAIGLTACMLLSFYVFYEWSFDKQQKDSDHIFQVLTNTEDGNGAIKATGYQTGNLIGPLLKQDYPAVKAMSRLSWNAPDLIANGTRSFKRKSRFADPDLLHIFDFDFVAGDRESALNAPNTVIVTVSTAKLLFGTTQVLNKVVRYKDQLNLTITGVVKDLPGNTSVNFDYLLPWSLYESLNQWVKNPAWTNYNWTTLVKLNSPEAAAPINLRIKDIIRKHTKSTQDTHFLFPMTKLHLHGSFTNGKSTGGRIEQVRLFMGLAVGILLIACINFMNMATARSEKRAKEVGIKKTIGATRADLVSQFLMESMMMTLLSGVMAVVAIELCLPLFNNLLDLQIDIRYSNPYLWVALTAVVIFTGLLAGSYPALYLSSFNPVQILQKQRTKNVLHVIGLRRILVTGQFIFAIVLIVSTIVIYQQIQFIKNRPVGYELNNLVEMPQDGELYAKFELFKTRLLQSGAVTAVNQSSGSMSNGNSSTWGLEWPGMDTEDKRFAFSQVATTYDFIKTTQVKLVAGRDFSPQFASDTAGLLLSNSAVKKMNLTKPVGYVLHYNGGQRTVVGVFEDFISGSPFSTDRPMIVEFNKDWSGILSMRLNPAQPAAASLATIEKITKTFNPAYPVEISFVNDLYAEKLKSEKVLGILSNLFGGLAIFISCLGLFGLAAYSAEQRTKEIGVRKVLGASGFELIVLLSSGFLKTVAVAIVIAIPVASYLMDNWLRKFEFHIDISWFIFLLTAVGTLLIALLTVSFQTYSAAKINPVDALKHQ